MNYIEQVEKQNEELIERLAKIEKEFKTRYEELELKYTQTKLSQTVTLIKAIEKLRDVRYMIETNKIANADVLIATTISFLDERRKNNECL